MATAQAQSEGEQKSWDSAQALQKKEELYTMGKLGFGTRDLQKRYEDILGPLTLFAPFFHEKVPEKVELDIERPVTPIDESIKTPPSTFSQLAKLIRRRIAAKPEITHITVEDQQTLAGIIMGEVNCIWPDIRRQVDDPFLTAEENKELQRRITVHIVTVCEQLFLHYVEKAKILEQRGVFSKQANMSRLNAQLSLDANKFLNILAVRRHIVADIRGVLSDSEEEYPDDVPPEEDVAPLSYQKLIETSRPKRKKRYRQTLEREVQDLTRQMPAIQPQKVLDYLPDVDTLQRGLLEQSAAQRRASIYPARRQGEKEAGDGRKSARDQERKSVSRPKMIRSRSLEVFPIETIFEDLGIDYDAVHKRRRSIEFDPKLPSEPKTTGVDTTKRGDTREYFQQDLKKLSTYRSAKDEGKDEQLAEDEDLPPLLQAISQTDRADARREELQKQLKKMEEQRAIQEKEERIETSDPTHPQPATVTTRMPNKSVVRTSDVRVSERVSLSSITLKLNTTVFNELNDDVNGNTIKKLDSNLFRGQEINEVYGEIMKTLPTDHMSYDQDEFVEQSSSHHALANHTILASSMLEKHGQDRVLNPALTKKETPPWGEDREEWSKSPIFNASFAKKPVAHQGLSLGTSAFLESLTPNINIGGSGTPGQDLGGAGGGLLAGTGPGGLDLDGAGMVKPVVSQGLMDDRNARSYDSWLAWWKNTISSDDYTKYLSTQETDFLGVVFHMYESDDEDGDASKSDKDVLSSSKMAKQRERDEKLQELRNQKTDFQTGMWNVNSVLMGGLGKDPEFEEEEEEPEESEETDSRARSRRSRSRQLLRTTSRGSTKSTASSLPKSATLRVPGARGGGRQSITRSGSRATTRDLTSRLSSTKSHVTSALPEPPSFQDRLEAIWKSLQMPDAHKLDMAIKYSSDDHMDKLETALDAWEMATEVILQREAILARLETFERLASDPDRFFQKGHRGSSVARLEEARQRSELYSRLHDLDVHVRDKVQFVHRKFADTPTFQGRPYLEKMKVDCTEMLYWLQQERRQYALEHATLAQGVKLPVADISTVSSVAASSSA